MRKKASLLTQTRALLRRFDLRARKGLGQHFLIDEEALERIISAAQLSPDDVVMEIGPGLGVLTGELAKRAGWVIAVELDGKLAAILRQTLSSFDIPAEAAGPLNYKVVANLPYYISSAVLRRFLEAPIKPQSMVVMMQKEVAQEIVAEPGRMSLLSVSVQLYGQPEIVDFVPARGFYPAPEVDSAILKITLYPHPALAVDRESFFALVRAGFSAARKQLANSLAQGLSLPKAEVSSLLERAEIAPRRRAETLSLEEWARLWQIFTQVEKRC
jgi:16S rRNA (adenine1518-N6/adenine1519-N6)-dimethyltransferase